jgi:hypothetical protein
MKKEISAIVDPSLSFDVSLIFPMINKVFVHSHTQLCMYYPLIHGIIGIGLINPSLDQLYIVLKMASGKTLFFSANIIPKNTAAFLFAFSRTLD